MLTETKLIELLEQHHKSAVILCAYKLGIFSETITPQTISEIADKTDTVVWKLEVLINTLIALGLLEKNQEGKYGTVDCAISSLVSSQESSITNYCDFLLGNWNSWSRYDKVFLNNASNQMYQDFSDIAFVEDYYTMQGQTNYEMYGLIADQVEIGENAFLVDVGGGDASFVKFLAEKTENSTFEVWDLPHAKDSAQKTILNNHLESRVKFQNCSIPLEFPKSDKLVDAITLINITHHISLSDFEALVIHSKTLLSASGNIYIGDTFLNETGIEPLGNLLFSNYLMLNNPQSKVHKICDIVSILSSFQ